jgi:hypothetical protein
MRTPLSSIAHLAARTGRRAAALLVALALLVSIVPAALAAGTPTGSGFEWLATPPSSIAVGALESDALMRVFAERTDFALTRDVAVDFTEPGTYTQMGDLAPTTIEAGTIVNSYYIHADQTDTRANVAVVATITFPDPIIGVILTDGRLSASKDVLGVAGTDYPTSGYELIGGCPSTQDCATLSEDRHSLTLRTTIYNVTDDLRVLTRGAQYAICPLYDQDKAHRLGSTVPIKLQLCDAVGTNLSAANIVVQATGLTKHDNTVSPVEDSGSANSPDDNFRYDASLGGDGGYIYNLSTKGLSTGTWVLSFTVDGDDDGTYMVRFDVK